VFGIAGERVGGAGKMAFVAVAASSLAVIARRSIAVAALDGRGVCSRRGCYPTAALKMVRAENDIGCEAVSADDAPNALNVPEWCGSTAFAAMVAMGVAPDSAMAADDALAMLFKTTPANLLHPLLMWALFAGSVYTFYLGYQARTLRTTNDSDKKKQLAKARPGQKHFATSASIMAIMTVFTFEGMANTFNRAGKLFPGPHLYNGLGLVALMSVMAALVPQMQKPASSSASSAARNAHFAMAFGALGLFAWQAKSGMDIVAKLLKWN